MIVWDFEPMKMYILYFIWDLLKIRCLCQAIRVNVVALQLESPVAFLKESQVQSHESCNNRVQIHLLFINQRFHLLVACFVDCFKFGTRIIKLFDVSRNPLQRLCILLLLLLQSNVFLLVVSHLGIGSLAIVESCCAGAKFSCPLPIFFIQAFYLL